MSAHPIVGRAALGASRVSPVHLGTSRLHERRALVLVAAALLLHRPPTRCRTSRARCGRAWPRCPRSPRQRQSACDTPCRLLPSHRVGTPSVFGLGSKVWGQTTGPPPRSYTVQCTESAVTHSCTSQEYDPMIGICCESGFLPPCPTKQSPLPALSSTWGDIRCAMAPIR